MFAENIENVNNKRDNNTAVNKSAGIPRKKKPPTEHKLVIPISDHYNDFLNHKFSIIQLKSICKHYKLSVSGSKQILTSKIYKYLYLSHHAKRIQKQWRTYYMQKYAKLHGPARFKRALCVNETDFFTMDAVKDIPYNQFFSYLDCVDNKIYGFDIMSMYNLIEINNKNNISKYNGLLNPYTRNPINSKVKNDFYNLMVLIKLLKEDVHVLINEGVANKVVLEAIDVNDHNIVQRVFSLFNDMDLLGYYTNSAWFMELHRFQLLLYFKGLYDIWIYRAQLTDQVKREICPHINPFAAGNIVELEALSFRELQHRILVIMETLVRDGICHNSKYLGATYVLCALTLVNTAAATSLPWLYESVYIN